MKKYHVTLLVWMFFTISTILLIKHVMHPADDPALVAKELAVAQAK